MEARWHKLKIALIVIVPFVALLGAIGLAWNRYVFVSDIVLLLVMHTLIIMGITIGYHRLLTHRSFQTVPFIRGIFLILGCMGFEGAPIQWAAIHIKHHAHSDHDGDPHSPLHGFWHAHMGWLFSVKNYVDPARYAPHLLKDKLVLFVDLYTPFWMVLSLVVPFMIGGWTGLLWGGVVRIFFTTHITYSVNSICHTFGRRQFATLDESHNNWLIGLLALGEGWHNNHHAFPSAAFHGFRWWQFDLSGWTIAALEKLGLAWEVKRALAPAIDKKKEQTEKLQYSLKELRLKVEKTAQEAYEELNLLRQRLPSLRPMCDHSLQRMDEIRQNLAHTTHLKQQKLMEYLDEAREATVQARHLFRKLKTKQSAI
jgi:stearoyl-CoA desaturase (delta-9 desaturase)